MQDGLSSEDLRTIAQDDLGFLWIGSRDGLSRFDGVESITYFKDSTENSIPNNLIEWVYWGSDKKLWIGTQGGLCSLDPRTNKIQRYENILADGVRRERVRCIKEDRQGRLWISYDNLLPSAGGIAILNRDTGEFQNFLVDLNLGINQFIQDFENDDIFWFGGYRSMGRFNSSTHELHMIDSPNANESIYPHQWIDYYSENELIITTQQDGILAFDTRNETFRQLSDQTKPNCVLHDSEENWWFTSVDGPVGLLNTKTGEKTLEKIAIGSEYGMPRRRGKTLLKDNQDVLWITHHMGLSSINPELQKFKVKRMEEDEGIISPYMRTTISVDATQQIVAFTNPAQGLYFFDSKSGHLDTTIHYYTHAPFKNELINAIDVHPYSDSVLIFSNGRGLFTLNIKSLQTATLLDTTGIGLPNRWFPEFDIQNSTICIGGYQANLHVFNLESKEFNIYVAPTKETDSRSLWTRNPHFDQDGRIWHSVHDMPGYFDPRTKTFRAIDEMIDIHISRELPHCNQPRTLGDSLVYYATQNKGITEINLKTGKKTLITDIDNNCVYMANSMEFDHDNRLWSATSKGLVRWDPKTKESRWFNVNNGLPNLDLYRATIKVGTDGIMSISYLNTLFWFDPNDFDHCDEEPQVVFTDFRFAGISSLSTAAPYLQEITLSPGLGSFDFSFTALNSSIPQNLQYAYILEGFDTEWQFERDRKSGRYNRIPAGEYTLNVKAMNEGGIWSPLEAQLSIKIRHAWYELWWVWLLVLTLILLTLTLLYRWRINSVRDKERMAAEFQKKIAEVEMTALRAQMNPHFLFNCLNSVKYFIVKNKVHEAADYLTKFSRLIRLILNNSKSERVPLSAELEALKLYIEMESLRFAEKFTYSIEVDENVDVEMIEMPPLMLQPFVENAVWHGLMHKDGPGELNVAITCENKVLKCTITDNGIGRKKALEYKSKTSTKNKSLGMEITSNRIEAINRVYRTSATIDIVDLTDGDGQPTGTQVNVTIPL